MGRACFLVLLVIACGDGDGEGGSSSWQPGLEHRPEPSQTTSGAHTVGPSSGTWGVPTCPDGSRGGATCSCDDEDDSIGECVCPGDSCYCNGCPTGACGTDFWTGYANDACLQHCCDAVRTCALEDDFSCDECLYAGGGELCADLISCATESSCGLTAFGLCWTGIPYDVSDASDRCIAANCCPEVRACVGEERENSAECAACIDGVDDPVCGPLLECIAAYECRGADGTGGSGAGGSGAGGEGAGGGTGRGGSGGGGTAGAGVWRGDGAAALHHEAR